MIGWVQGADEQPIPSLPWVLLLLLALVALAHGQTLLGTGAPGAATCDLNLVVVGTAGMVWGPAFGFWIGVAGGFFHDLASSPAPIGLFALGAALFGWTAGTLWRWTVRNRWGVAGMLMALLTSLHFVYVRFMLQLGGLGAASLPAWGAIGEGLALTFVLGAVVYGAVSFGVHGSTG